MAPQTKLEQAFEYRMCRGDGPTDWRACLYFAENYVKIRHPERGRIAFELREAQRETLQAWLTERYNIVLKARQIGYSTLVAVISLWLAMFHGDKLIIMLSRGEREATKLLAKSKYAYRYLPEWLKERGPRQISDTNSRVAFDNESSIDSLPSTQDPARGESAYLIVVDEWAFLENPEDAWASIEPVADVGGRVIGLSTANGSGNFFHTFWQRAWTGHGRFKPLFYPWSANSDRDMTWYDDKAEDLAATPWILHQEYPRSPEEAFIKSGRSVFDVDALEALDVLSPIAVGVLWARTPESKYAEFYPEPNGELKLYEAPTPLTNYCIGADVAEGGEHGDYSSAHVFDPHTNAVVATWHGHLAPDLFGEVLVRLGYFYNTALLGVEANNHGHATLLAIRNLSYKRVFYRRQIDDRSKKASNKLGWLTTATTKPLCIDGLVTALRGTREVVELEDGTLARAWVDGLQVRDLATISELKLFVREPDGKKMHGSPYDDRTMSLAIAVAMGEYVNAPRYKPQVHDQWGTLDYWADTLTPVAANGPIIGVDSVSRYR